MVDYVDLKGKGFDGLAEFVDISFNGVLLITEFLFNNVSFILVSVIDSNRLRICIYSIMSCLCLACLASASSILSNTRSLK
jgi:hypothetical protein